MRGEGGGGQWEESRGVRGVEGGEQRSEGGEQDSEGEGRRGRGRQGSKGEGNEGGELGKEREGYFLSLPPHSPPLRAPTKHRNVGTPLPI